MYTKHRYTKDVLGWDLCNFQVIDTFDTIDSVDTVDTVDMVDTADNAADIVDTVDTIGIVDPVDIVDIDRSCNLKTCSAGKPTCDQSLKASKPPALIPLCEDLSYSLDHWFKSTPHDAIEWCKLLSQSVKL